MHARFAPEARGRKLSGRTRLAGRIGSLLFALAALAGSSAAGAIRHHLSAATPEPKPAFTLPGLNGAQQALQQQAGRIVLVHFFATWCEPCREELSSLSQLLRTHTHAPLTVMAVNVAEVPVRVQRFLETGPVDFPVLLDADRAVTRAWGVSILPTTFVLDRALVPRLFVEGDIDWTRADVLEALRSVAGAEPNEQH